MVQVGDSSVHGVVESCCRFASIFNQNLCFGQGVEDLALQQFVSHLAVETLNVAVLPRTTGFDEQGLHLERSQPVSHPLSNKLRAIVRSDMSRHTAPEKEPVERM